MLSSQKNTEKNEKDKKNEKSEKGNVTAVGNLVDHFEKKPKIASSPVRPRASSTSSVYSKRNRDSDEDIEDNMKEIKKILCKMEDVTGKLVKIIGEHINTKSELKSGIKEMKWLTECMKRRFDELQEPVHAKKKTTGKTFDSKETCTDSADMIEDAETESQELQRLFDSGTDFPGLEAILGREWPNEVFANTQCQAGRPSELSAQWDWLILTDQKEVGRTGLLKHVSLKYPEILELLQDSAAGSIEYIVDTKTTSKSKTEVREKYIFLMPHDDKVTNEDIYNYTKELLQTVKAKNRKRVAVMTTGTVSPEVLRKTIEYISKQENIEWVVLNPKDKKVSRANTSQTVQGDTVVISTGSSSYSDVLKTMKQNLDMDSMGVRVKQLRKSNNGDLIIKIVGEKDRITSVKDEIAKTLPSTKVALKRDDKVYNILDMDDVTTEEEVLDCLSRETGIEKKDLTLKSLRSNVRGSQTAAISVPAAKANQIDKLQGKVKIGWLRCRIKRKVQLVRCYRCLEYGHKTFECKGEDKSGNCMNCGKKGHLAKSCSEGAYCGTCKTEGHRMDSMKCPLFREQIKKKEVDSQNKRRRLASETVKQHGQAKDSTNQS